MMAEFPFISRRIHAAIVAVKDEQIALLRQQLLDVRNDRDRRAQEHADLSTRLVEAIEQRMTPVRPIRRPVEAAPAEREPESLDLSMVDPNDNEALALIVRREMPPGARVSGTHVMRAIERLREQVIQAHEARTSGAVTAAVVQIPERVSNKIEAAKRAGKELATVGA